MRRPSSEENLTLSKGYPGGRSEQAKLTACRKVGRYVSAGSPLVKRSGPKKTGFPAFTADAKT